MITHYVKSYSSIIVVYSSSHAMAGVSLQWLRSKIANPVRPWLLLHSRLQSSDDLWRIHYGLWLSLDQCLCCVLIGKLLPFACPKQHRHAYMSAKKAPISTIPTINLHVRVCHNCLVNSSIREGSHPWKAATIIQSWTYVLHFKRGFVWCLGAQWWQRKSAHLPHYSALDSIASSCDCCAKRPTWAQHHVRAASPTSICKSQLFATISRMVSIK